VEGVRTWLGEVIVVEGVVCGRRGGGFEVTSRELGMCLSGRRGQAGRWCAAEPRRDARERPGGARAMSGRVVVGAFSCSS
jgi:hypothetical protein